MSYQTIETGTRDGVMTLRLNRPEALNAIPPRCAADVRDALRYAGGDPAVRVICITGNGRAFSAGADLKDNSERTLVASGAADLGSPMLDKYGEMILTVREVPKPVIAAVNGGAAGVGASLALACDMVLAHESAYFLLAFVNVGLVPDGGAVPLIGSRIGIARAVEMAMLGERIPAAQALEWGMVNRVLDDEQFQPTVEALLARLAAGPPLSYAGTKEQVNATFYPTLGAATRLEAAQQQRISESRDFAEGVTAFAEKRPARFTGE
ncbi:MAG TPA: enoyl-CoA hydratase-related protein [Solirubrobacteraceae bacterium]|nr:enoyl-CoA hydratase-related protein [Solirubrobacteraceae bacterium]